MIVDDEEERNYPRADLRLIEEEKKQKLVPLKKPIEYKQNDDL